MDMNRLSGKFLKFCKGFSHEMTKPLAYGACSEATRCGTMTVP